MHMFSMPSLLPLAFTPATPLSRPPYPTLTSSSHLPRPRRPRRLRSPLLNMQYSSLSLSRRTSLRLLALSALSPPLHALASVRVADPDAATRIYALPSGVRYYDFITPPPPSPEVSSGDRVSVHYTLGTTGARNGWRIDSSYDREPLVFTVGRGEVVHGLEEGVLGMRLGGKRRVLIPAVLGYRTRDDRPVVMGFAAFQRFKNIYLNPDRQYKPDLVMDVTVVKVREGGSAKM